MSRFFRFRLRQIFRLLRIGFGVGGLVDLNLDIICRHLHTLGFQPKTIVDIGSLMGCWNFAVIFLGQR